MPFAGVGQRPGPTRLKKKRGAQAGERRGQSRNWRCSCSSEGKKVGVSSEPCVQVMATNPGGPGGSRLAGLGGSTPPPLREDLGWGPGSHETPALTWSFAHSRSQVLWASTHRCGLSWLGHMPGWLPGSGSRLVSEVRWMSTKTKSRGRGGCGAGMGTTGPEGGSVWPPARTPYGHPPYRVLGPGSLPLPHRTLS